MVLGGLLGSIASGALSGAALGAAPFATGFSAAFVVGAVGGTAGYVGGQSVKGESITIGGLLVSGLIGGACGAASFGLGKFLSSWYSNALEHNKWAAVPWGVKHLPLIKMEEDWTKVLAGMGISLLWTGAWAVIKALASRSGFYGWGPHIPLAGVDAFSV